MTDNRTPALSVILFAADGFDSVQLTLKHLREQTVADQLEIVVITAPANGSPHGPSGPEEFRDFRVIESRPGAPIGAHKATGVRAARAPLVVFAEDHSLPEPDWAEALIRAHAGPWAAVGPVLGNANPANLISQADMVIAYGPWVEPAEGGIVSHLPPNNSSYKRDLLLTYGAELDNMLHADTVLQWDLRQKGLKLYLEPAAKTNHINFSLVYPWLRAHLLAGRIFAAIRASQWSLVQRLAYTCGAPLIPLVRLWRVLREMGKRDLPLYKPPGLLPAFLVALVVDGVGQMIGYAVGANSETYEAFSQIEVNRLHNIRPEDLQEIGNR